MDFIQALVLAVVQGVTEFLPISSSAHLILTPYLFGWGDQGLSFDIAANTGSLIAVVWYFKQELRSLFAGFFRTFKERTATGNPEGGLAWAVGFATIPVGICGLLFKEQIGNAARDPMVIAAASIVFGLLLWWADGRGQKRRTLNGITWKDVALFGMFQAVALIPGTSRSGITITAGLLAGFTRVEAARFSFLMAIPVGVLAALLDLKDLLAASLTARDWGLMAVGLAVSGISAYLVIDWLMAWLARQGMTPFVVYRVGLGLLIYFLVF